MTDAACDFCGLQVFTAGRRHPCCEHALARGDESCYGCERFKRRWAKGETCPHVFGAIRVGDTAKPVRACCRPVAS